MRNRGFTVIIGSLSIVGVRKTEKLHQQVGGFLCEVGLSHSQHERWVGWCRFGRVGAERRGCSNPSVLTAERFGDKKDECVAIKTQQSNSLCFAVKPPPFDKGGKCDSAFRGIVRFLKEHCQCSCNDALTKILMPCWYGKCFRQCWRYVLRYSHN